MASLRVSVHAHPGASRERMEWQGEVLHVWVTARALDGQANRALVGVLAKHFGTRPSSVTLLRGVRGRDKLFEIDGSSPPGPTSGTPGRS